MNKFYKCLYFLLSKYFRLLYRIKVDGLANEPQDGALLICANHTSFRDILVLAVTLRHHQIRFCAKAELFKIPILRHLFRALGAFPLHRGQADVAAIKGAIGMLEAGESVGIFPQGTRHAGEVPTVDQFRNGVGMIACRAKADVLPMLIYNKGMRVRPFRRTYVRIGEVISCADFGFVNGGKTEYTAAAAKIAAHICALHPDAPALAAPETVPSPKTAPDTADVPVPAPETATEEREG